jgi:DNA repair protein RadC
MENFTSIKISALAEDERPREKLILKGKAYLTDAELIAILIGTGTKQLSALDLARQILNAVQHNLAELSKLNVKDLQKFKGIGEAKAIAIVSALELGRRRKSEQPLHKIKISSSSNVYDLMKSDLLYEQVEHFYVVLLSRNNLVLKKQLVSSGGTNAAIADPKIIFKHALDHLASAMILVHNHPSGNLKPSEADRKLTEKLVAAGKNLDIPVLDHVIFTDVGYFSFADEGLI